MVKCVCGKEIAAVPDWLKDVKVTFICNNCPTRNLQGITEVDFSDPTQEEEEEKPAEKAAKDGKEEDGKKG